MTLSLEKRFTEGVFVAGGEKLGLFAVNHRLYSFRRETEFFNLHGARYTRSLSPSLDQLVIDDKIGKIRRLCSE
jgi:hypothetical protein